MNRRTFESKVDLEKVSDRVKFRGARCALNHSDFMGFFCLDIE